MSGRVRLVVAVVAAATVAAAGIPVAAQQPPVAAQVQGARGVFASIQGTAVNWSNTAMVSAPIRLRDARLGRLIDTVTTDRFGAFEFRSLEPGSYVVEMLNASNDSVLASSPIINVSSGQRASALVKLPFRPPPAGGALGSSLASALAITSAAVAAGVLATSVAGAPATDRALPGQR